MKTAKEMEQKKHIPLGTFFRIVTKKEFAPFGQLQKQQRILWRSKKYTFSLVIKKRKGQITERGTHQEEGQIPESGTLQEEGQITESGTPFCCALSLGFTP